MRQADYTQALEAARRWIAEHGRYPRGFHLEDKVKRALASASADQREDFYRVLDRICVDPFGVGSEIKNDLPSTYTAS